MEKHIISLIVGLLTSSILSFENRNSTSDILQSQSKNKYDLPLIYILNNYTDIEPYLKGYIREKKYAELKEIIDKIEEKIPQYEKYKCDINDKKNASGNTSAEEIRPTDLEILEAYQNATIYNIIYALWNWKVENVLPEIDQNAILEYYGEKEAEERARQSLIAKLWTLIKNLFRQKEEDDSCHANKPECIRQVVNNLDEKQKLRLKRAAKKGNSTEISRLMEEKMFGSPDLQTEYYNWIAENSVPQALCDIVEGLTDAQLRAMENLRRLELKDAIKDYYRGMIERRSLMEQQEIENFFHRMNKTFAKCYNPSGIKEASQKLANKLERWQR